MSTAIESKALRQRYESVLERIASAAARSGRPATDVLLVAVTKGATLEQIVDLALLGHADFGENRVQALIERVPQVAEALRARPELRDVAARWHMIGSLQRNKVRRGIELIHLIHSVENMKLAETIHEEAMRAERVVDVLVQVNVSGEARKHGMNSRAVKPVLEQMQTMAGLELRGLMTMAPATADPETARPVFEGLRELFEEIRQEGLAGPRFNLLSMGMSSDFEVAIECGSNVVRVGSAIFSASTHTGAAGIPLRG
jgi:hypothetical protein